MTPTHQHILTSARRGERKAQHELYQVFAPRVFGVCLRYARDRNEADDMAQETWIRAFSKLHTCKDLGAFGGWLRRVTVNSCLQYLRNSKLKLDDNAAQRLAEGDNPLPENLQVAAQAISNLSAEELVNHIQQLPEGFRAIFNLVAIEGYSHAEAAKALGITESTSRSQLTRARIKLQKRLSTLITVCL